MWYVNDIKRIFGWVDNDTFILTMWYVNEEAFDKLRSAISAFILTMWYVNFKSATSKTWKYSPLY